MNRPRRTLRGALWLLLAAAACTGFVLLGNWQVRRLHWKLGLIHDVDTRVHASPVAAPGPARWPEAAHGGLQYLHVHLRGRYLDVPQTLVHGTSRLGYGYWVLAPLRTDRGFIVLVNRGYVPADVSATKAFGRMRPPPGEIALDGLLRPSESGGGVLRRNRPAEDQWYSRDVAAIAAARGLPATRVAPYFVDADADSGASGDDVPVAGLTVIRFRNHHLGYALTWYLMALGCLLGAALAIFRARGARHRP